MSASPAPERVLNIRLPSVAGLEEYIAHQLAVIGLQLHKLGRLDAYRGVIMARNHLLDILDEEFMPQRKKSRVNPSEIHLDFVESAIVRPRAKRSGLKGSDRLR